MSHVSELPRAAAASKTAARVTQRAALTSLFYTRTTTNPAGISQPALPSHPQDSNTGQGARLLARDTGDDTAAGGGQDGKAQSVALQQQQQE